MSYKFRVNAETIHGSVGSSTLIVETLEELRVAGITLQVSMQVSQRLSVARHFKFRAEFFKCASFCDRSLIFPYFSTILQKNLAQ